jgi:hypothetical protein
MKNGWREVARFGIDGACYPQILVDGHGWCLRMGPSSRQDDKYYSSFGSVFEGLREHTLRRCLPTEPPAQGFKEFERAVRNALSRAAQLGRALARKTDRELQLIPAQGPGEPRTRLALVPGRTPRKSSSLRHNGKPR